MGTLSLALGGSPFAVIAVYLLLARPVAQLKAQDSLSPVISVLVLSVFLGGCALSSFLLGSFALLEAKGKTGRATGGIVLSILLVSVLILAVPFSLLSGRLVNHRDDTEKIYRPNAAFRPIEIASTPRTHWEDRLAMRDWLRRNMIGTYEANGNRNPVWDTQALDFMNHSIELFSRTSDRVSLETAREEAEALLKLGCDDPACLFCRGMLLERRVEWRPALRNALDGLSESRYPKGLSLLGVLSFGSGLGGGDVPLAEEALRYLEQSLRDGSFRSEEMPVLLGLLLARRSEWLVDVAENEAALQVCRILDESRLVEKWMSLTVWGNYYMKKAWRCRGTGWSDTVSEDGWQGFQHCLEQAGERLEEAYALRPDRPEAASIMITVDMGMDKPTGALRVWFERAVAAQADYPQAYTAFLYALWPRWGGSEEEMRHFGWTCLTTERYDTLVPFMNLRALWQARAASDLETVGILLEDDRTYRDFVTMIQGYLIHSYEGHSDKYFCSHWAISAFTAKRYQDAYDQLREIDWELSWLAEEEWRFPKTKMLQWCSALGGPMSERIGSAEEAFQNHDLEKADRLFQECLSLPMEGPHTMPFVRGRLKAIEIEKELRDRDWVDCMPDEEFHGWEIHGGDWEIDKEGSLLVNESWDDVFLLSQARVGLDFRVRGRVKIVDEEICAFQAGIVFGDPSFAGNKWMTLLLWRTKEGDSYCRFARRFRGFGTKREVELGLEAEWELRCHGGRLTAFFNEEEVLSDVKLADEVRETGKNLRIGLGHSFHNQGVQLRYEGLQIGQGKGGTG